MIEIFYIYAIIFILSLVQSIIGVGLLVFGTPSFMLLGFSFQETLGIVLPPSIIISLLQVYESSNSSKSIQRDFNIFCLPFVLIGLIFILTGRAGQFKSRGLVPVK